MPNAAPAAALPIDLVLDLQTMVKSMKGSRCSVLVFSLLISSLLSFSSLAATSDDWKPIDSADLALKNSTVEKEADAEALFWEVRIDDSHLGELSLKNYIRIKIFTERGKESQSKVDLPYLGFRRIKDIAARVIKADGSIVEL